MLVSQQFIDIDKLEIVEVYEYYDRPLLFSCRNALGHLYLAVLVEENEESEVWYYVGVSRTRLDYVHTGGIDLRTAFAEPEDGSVLQIKIFEGAEHQIVIEKIPVAHVNDEYLPEPGEYLNLPAHTLPVLTEDLVKKSRTAMREFLKVRFNFHGTLRSEAPTKQLGKILTAIQDIITAIGLSLSGSESRTGRIGDKLARNTELSFTGAGAGSFEIELAGIGNIDLFEESTASSALSEFIDLIEIGSDEDRLKERLGSLKIRAAGRYLELLRALNERADSTYFELAIPKSPELHRAKLSLTTAEEIISIIERTVVEKPEEISVQGILTKIDVRRKTFSLEVPKAKGRPLQYSGDISDQAFDVASSATMSQLYTAHLRIIKDIQQMTGEVQQRYELISLDR